MLGWCHGPVPVTPGKHRENHQQTQHHCCSFHRPNSHSTLFIVNNTFNLKKNLPWAMSGLHVFSVWFLVMHFLRLLYIGYILKIHLYINSAIIYRCYVANNFFAKVHIFFWIWHCSPEKLVKKKTSDQKLNTVIPEQFRRLTAFADDDEEAALEIIKNVKLALNEHLQIIMTDLHNILQDK